jgi:two-component system, LytTR family, sensor histidine kinase AlgZ
MHPFFKDRLRLALYLFAWLVVGLGLAALLWLIRATPMASGLALMEPLALLYAAICLSALWVARGLPLHSTPPIRLLVGWIMASVQASAVWVVLGLPWAIWLGKIGVIPTQRADMVSGAAAFLALGIPLYLGSLTVHYLLLAFEASREAERTLLSSQVSAREAEVRALRAQLNPHFLFNSLNSINSLIGSDPEGARRMCESLGDFLRRTLALGARDAVPLGEELALVDHYLDIEQVRFGARLQVERDFDPAAARCRVPPLLLQPLVENAVKHGIQHCLEGGAIRLETRRAEDRLLLVVENPVDPDAPARPGEGVGLANVRRRLEVFGTRDTRLRAERQGRRFCVRLELPALEGAESPAAGAPQPAVTAGADGRRG